MLVSAHSHRPCTNVVHHHTGQLTYAPIWCRVGRGNAPMQCSTNVVHRGAEGRGQCTNVVHTRTRELALRGARHCANKGDRLAAILG